MVRTASNQKQLISRRARLQAALGIPPALGLLTGCSVPLFGPNNPFAAPVSINLYYGPFSAPQGADSPEPAMLTKILAGFKKSYSNITVTPISLDFSSSDSLSQALNPVAQQYGDVYLSYAALPDVRFSQLPLSLSDIVTPVDAYMQRDSDASASAFYPQAISRATIDGHVMALPRDIQPEQVVLYNRTLFARDGIPPLPDEWTTDVFLNVVQMLTRAGSTSKNSATTYGYVDVDQLASLYDFIMLFGGRRSTEPPANPRITLDSTRALAGASFYVDLYQKQRVAATPAQRPAAYEFTPLIDFMEGNIPLMLAPGTLLGTIHGMQRPLDWDVAMLPVAPGVTEAWFGAGAAVFLGRLSRHLDEGWQLAKYLCVGEGMNIRAQVGDVHPAAQKVAISSAYLGDPKPPSRRLYNSVGMAHMLPVDAAVSLARLSRGGPLTATQPDFPAADTILRQSLDDLLSGKADVASVLKQATTAGNANLSST